MPIDRWPEGIAIINPIYGGYATNEELPYMSKDTFDWIRSYITVKYAPTPQMVESLTKDLMKDTEPYTLRAHYAAARCYRPKLAEDDRTLTAYGYEVAKKADAVQKLVSHTDTSNSNGLDIEFMMIVAHLRWRAIRLLALIDVGIKRALSDWHAGLRKAGELPPEPIEHETKVQSGIAPVYDKESENILHTMKVVEIMAGITIAHDYEPVDIKPVLIRSTMDELVCYVPVRTLGVGKGRTDWKELARYGLVDVRSIRDGSRGRTPLALTVSRPGATLISDLTKRGWL